MPTSASDFRLPWTDRFEAPTLERLRKSFNPETRPLFDAARTTLADKLALAERLQWLGLPWRWSFVYNHDTAQPATRGFVYLIPNPSSLQLCVPLTAETIDRLPMRKFKKPIREALVHARNAAGVWWPSWELTTNTIFDDVFELVRAKIDAANTHPEPVEFVAAKA